MLRKLLSNHEQRSHPRCKLLRQDPAVGSSRCRCKRSVSLPGRLDANCRSGAGAPVAVARTTSVHWGEVQQWRQAMTGLRRKLLIAGVLAAAIPGWGQAAPATVP